MKIEEMQQHQIFVTICTILAFSSFLVQDDYFFSYSDYDTAPSEGHRSLRLAQYLDSNSTTPHVKITITVYLTRTRWPNNAFSIFKTDILQRYGSGQYHFNIVEPAPKAAPIDYRCKQPVADNHPCLAVTDGRWYLNQNLMCMYPQCKTMITNDEQCKQYEYDVRQYYSANIPDAGYLPLGPRLDAWKSFHKIQSSPGFFIKHASKRRYAFNAIFSQSTNKSRKQLAQIIENQRNNSTLPIFTNMAKEWNRDANNPRSEQLGTDSYTKIVLDSIFTLSPAGHNPECYRMFEAVEAGSIPILLKINLNPKGRCIGALHHWYDAPIVILESWDDLYPTVEKLMKNLEALDKMQTKLHTWYDEYMHMVVGEFEDFMIDSYGLEESAEGDSKIE
ncbi:hypothetical protein ACHAXR_011503 [Thalassiosira sp. AJA248-18]